MAAIVTALDWLTEAGLVGLLLLAPLPFAAVDLWASNLLVGTVAGLVALAGVRMLVGGRARVVRTPLLWPALAGLVLALAQLRPGGSVDPYATGQSVRLCAAYVALLVVLANHLTTRARVLRLVTIQVVWGTGLALLGLANRWGGRMLVPWFPADFAVERLVSTFVNPNHQALYLEMTFFLALGLLLRPAAGSRPDAEGRPKPRPGHALSAALLVGGLLVLGSAIGLTVSRGGFLGLAVGLLAVCAVGLWGGVGRRTALPAMTVVVALIGAGLWIGMDQINERLSRAGRDAFADVRLIVWERTLALVGDAPVLGTGLGTYEDAFPLHRPPGIQSQLVIDHAHNDYLELAVELGLPGLVVAGWALLGLVAFVLPRWRARHDPFVRGLTLGGLGAVAAVAAHSVLDFGLHMPANAVLAVTVAALLPNTVALRTRRGAGGGVDLPVWDRPLSPAVRGIGGLAVAGALVAVVSLVTRTVAADWQVQRAAVLAGARARGAGTVTMRDLLAAYGLLGEAVRLEPANPGTHSALAEVAEDLAVRIWQYGIGPDGRRLAGSIGERVQGSQPYFATALVAYDRSLALNGHAARVHDRFGRFLGLLEQVRQAIRGSSLVRVSLDPRLASVLDATESLIPRALAQLRDGVRLDPMNPYRHRNLGFFALSHGGGQAGTEVAAQAFRRALTLDPAFLAEIVDRLETAGASLELLRASLPQREDVWFALGRHYEARRRYVAAAGAYEEALGLVRDPAREVQVRLALGQSLLQAKQLAPALNQVRRALILAPRDPEAYLALAGIYEGLQEWDKAAGALQSAVSLAERDADARNHYRDELAQFYTRHGRYAEALIVRRQLVQDAPTVNDHRWNLALVLARNGKREEALEELAVLERASPRNVMYRVQAARVLSELGRGSDAIAKYEGALEIAPEQVDLRVEYAGALAQLGARDRAAEQYRLILARSPGHDGARRALAALGAEVTSPRR